MKTYTSTAVDDLRTVAVRAYLQSGGNERGAESAWRAVRARVPSLRAPSGLEALARNGSRARSYRSPLGETLRIPGASGEYGHHCASYPRTIRSQEAYRATRDVVLAWFDRETFAI